MIYDMPYEKEEQEMTKLTGMTKAHERNYKSHPKEMIQRGHEAAEEIFNLIPHEIYIAGGFARWMVNPTKILSSITPPADVDIFLRHEEDLEAVISILEEKSNDIIGSPDESHYTERSITFRDLIVRIQISNSGSDGMSEGIRIPLQIILPRVSPRFVTTGSVIDILDSFDMIHAMVAIHRDMTVTTYKDFLRYELPKRIGIHNPRNPIESMQRVIKFCKMGYKVDMMEIANLFLYWDNNYGKLEKDTLFDEAMQHEGMS